MTIEEALAAVTAVRDCPAVRRLCLDCWVWAQTHGEAAGLEFAAMLLDGVKRYVQHERDVKRAASWSKRDESQVVGA